MARIDVFATQVRNPASPRRPWHAPRGISYGKRRRRGEGENKPDLEPAKSQEAFDEY